ncbi:MAG: 3-phosphoshikimate 1-carboxyvinyltransferase [Desulfobacca sp.]|uniref:3-phosphoshikimate 1-carboxyvinyltransferase n=1 Tax=Desulfobacca sp. TaxID=2067990 RepID=UPI00404A8A64
MSSVREITPVADVDVVITLPGSKSFSHRALIAAGLAAGTSTLRNLLAADDTRYTAQALRQLGCTINWQGDLCQVTGTGGHLQVPQEPMYLGDSGTSMRFLTAVAALGQGRFVLTGSARLCQRPIQDLLEALAGLGVEAVSRRHNGCPPVVVQARGLAGGPTKVAGAVSSQVLSALLLISPFAARDVEIEVVGELVSRPYVDITLSVLEDFGIAYYRQGYRLFAVPAGQQYQAQDYEIEGDASSASYFLGAAAVTGGRVKLTNLNPASCQGDTGFLQVLADMGCTVQPADEGVMLQGGPLRGVQINMANMPDLVPTLAVVAAFAQGQTVITGVPHLRYKESNRLQAVATELAKMGIAVQETPDGLIITGGRPQGALIATYNDHRMAMSFALAGLRTPGVRIADPHCVAKSFPDFWKYFDKLARS